jgi:hypothetical protein
MEIQILVIFSTIISVNVLKEHRNKGEEGRKKKRKKRKDDKNDRKIIISRCGCKA